MKVQPGSRHLEQQQDIDFSVVITCYYENDSIDEFYSRLSKSLKHLNRTYEIIFVNDGSRDGTWDKLKAIFSGDPHVHAILDLCKNSGQAAAVTAGINEIRGRALLWMDSDLQLAPEEIPRLVAVYDQGYDLVTGYRKDRKDSAFRTLPSYLANMIMRRASVSTVRDFGCTFKIYNATVVHAFRYGPFRILSNVELISRIDRIAEVPVSHQKRKYGKSGWTFGKLMKYNMDNVVLLSERPFQASALLSLLLAFLFGIRVAVDRFFPMRILTDVSPGLLLNAIVFALLVNVGLLSLVGEFAIRSFLVVRSLPRYIVREKHSR